MGIMHSISQRARGFAGRFAACVVTAMLVAPISGQAATLLPDTTYVARGELDTRGDWFGITLDQDLSLDIKVKQRGSGRGFDSEVYVFADDGNLGWSDLLGRDDDSGARKESALQIALAAGDYWLWVVADRVADSTGGTASYSGGSAATYGGYGGHGYGGYGGYGYGGYGHWCPPDLLYKLKLTTSVPAVPLPAGLPLLLTGFGLLAAVAKRRRAA